MNPGACILAAFGQTMNVEIQSVEGNAAFNVVAGNTNAVAEGEKSWSGELLQRGK